MWKSRPFTVKPVLRGQLWDKEKMTIRHITSFNSFEFFYDRNRKRWPFNASDCLIEVTASAVLTVYCKKTPMFVDFLSVGHYRGFNMFQVYQYFTIYSIFYWNLNYFHEYLVQHSFKSDGTKDHFRWVKVPGTAPYWEACILGLYFYRKF
jgi:hypothetical protein